MDWILQPCKLQERDYDLVRQIYGMENLGTTLSLFILFFVWYYFIVQR